MSNKKIGGYLIENKVCNESTIKRALELQATLSTGGTYQPIGKIMVENKELDPALLEECLQQQRIDILSSNSMFKGLPPELLAKIAEVAENYVIPGTITLFNEHDPGDTYFIIVSGTVEIFRVSDYGDETTLVTLASGEGFGEMSLLTGEPRSASVKTVEPTSFLVIPKNSFDTVLETNPVLAKIFLKLLSERLSLSNRQLAKTSSTERAYKQFISEQSSEPELEVVGESKHIRRLREAISRLSANDPVLIVGEEGTEKRSIAALIHRNVQGPDTPFLILDAKNVHLISANQGAGQGDPLQLELAQESSLFGHQRGSFSFAKTRRLGFIEVASKGTLVIENIDQLVESVQMKLAAFIQTHRFSPLGGHETAHASTRILATTTTDLLPLVNAGKFCKELYELLVPQTLSVPPLNKRKKDIRLIVNNRIERYNELFGKTIKGINTEAYNKLMSYNWPGNTEELDVVIRRAVNLADSDIVMPEHFFIGLVQIEGKITFNLLKVKQVRQVFQSRLFPVLPQVVAAFFFLLVFLLGFFGNQLPENNITVILTWGIWWPFLVVSWFLAARVWCAICPMGALSDLLSRLCSLHLNVPRFIRNYGIYLGALGLLLIIWAEAATAMPFSPRATAILLVSLTILASTSGLLFTRRVWCRFICPLGKITGVMSRCSVIELRSNLNVCNSSCTTHGCYVGDKQSTGCPMYEGPFSMKSNQHCILCGNCVKICPDKAPKLNVRLPGYELWTILRPEKTVVVFLPLILATQLFRGLEITPLFHHLEAFITNHLVSLTLSLVGMICISYLYIRAAASCAFSQLTNSDIKKTGLFVYALIPLCFLFEISYHIEPLLTRAGSLLPVLGRQLGFNWDTLGVKAAFSSITFFQCLLVVVGLITSKFVLNKIRKQHEVPLTTPMTFRRGWPLVCLGVVYLYFFIAG